MAALREMLLNALVHRTYMGAPVQIRVFDEKLSIWNEGQLPQGLSLENLKQDHNSRPRNPKIAEACFKAGYIDMWGRGTLKILNSCREAELPDPEMAEKDGGIEVLVFKTTAGGQTGGQTGGQIPILTDRQNEVFGFISANPRISRKQLAEKLGINESAVQKHLKTLTDLGLIERVGTHKGHWKILIDE